MIRSVGLLLACALIGTIVAKPPDWAVAVFPSGAEFNLEIAADPLTRARGYMFREHVGPHEGMLFLFDEIDRHGIWMKNCKVALDILYLDSELNVVDIAHELQPCPAEGECEAYTPMRVAAYVIEVAGGGARREGLEVGDRVVILSEPAFP